MKRLMILIVAPVCALAAMMMSAQNGAVQHRTVYGKVGSPPDLYTRIGRFSACGPPEYCAYTGATMALWPSVPDMGGVLKNGRVFYDRSLPSANPSPVVRCADQSIEPNSTIANQSKSAGLGGSGDAEQLFNTNSTLVRFNTSGGAGHITRFNPTTMDCGDPVTGYTITADKNQTNPGSASSGYHFGSGSFSWTDPKVYFGFGSGNDAPANGVAKYIIDTGTGNFTVQAPYLDFTYGLPVGNLAPAWQASHAYVTGDYVSYTISLPDWSGATVYAQGDLILPLTNNPLNCAFKLSTAGTRGPQPSPWSLTSDGSCVTAQTKTESGGTSAWRNIGNGGAFTYQLTSAGGNSGSATPNFATASGHPDLLSTVSDGSLTWTNTGTMLAPRWKSFAGVSKDSNRFCSAFSSNAYGHPSHYDLDNGGQGTGIYVGCYDFGLNEFVLLNTATGIQSGTTCSSGTGYACTGGTLSKLTAMGSAYTAITSNCRFEVHNAKGGSTLDYVVVAKQGNIGGTCNGQNLLSWQPFWAEAEQGDAAVAVPAMIFGAHYNQTASMYPPVAPLRFNAIRLWDTRTGWADLQSDANCTHTVTTGCKFSGLDSFLAKFSAGSSKPKIILTLGKTPNFIASNVLDANCGYTSAFGSPNGTCTPPTDVNCDGSGTDATWIQFVTALWDHLAATGNLGKISYLEIWNEWNVPNFWDMAYINGTRCASTPNAAQKILVRLEQDARCILKAAGTTNCNAGGTYPVKGAEPAVQIMSSPLSSPGANNVRLSAGGSQDDYLSAGGGTYADVLSIHGYVFNKAQANASCGSAPGNAGCSWPENVATMLTQLQTLQASHGLNLPIYVSEGSWVADSSTNDPQFEQAFMGRYLALMAQYGAANFNWYNADDAGNPGTGTTTQLFANVDSGSLTAGGRAYETVQEWLTGKAFSASACTITSRPSCSGGANSHIYECGLTSGEKLVWYDEIANNASCSYAPTGFGWYRTIDGGSGSIAGPSMTLDNRPMLLEPFSQDHLQIYNTASNHWTIGKKLFVNVGDQSVVGWASGVYTVLLDSANATAAPKISWQAGEPYTRACDVHGLWHPGDENLPCLFADAYDSHTAFWHGPLDDDTGPVCGTMYNYSTMAPPPVAPYHGEEVCISTNPSWNLGDPIGAYKVWRFTHTFATGGNSFFDTQFAISQLSQDGKFLAFSSDWNCTLGSTAGGTSSMCGPPWVAGTAYAAGQMINPFSATTGSGTNYGVYQVTTAGVASASKPAWFVCNSSTAGNTITDSNGVVYTCLGTNNGKGEVFIVGLK